MIRDKRKRDEWESSLMLGETWGICSVTKIKKHQSCDSAGISKYLPRTLPNLDGLMQSDGSERGGGGD